MARAACIGYAGDMCEGKTFEIVADSVYKEEQFEADMLSGIDARAVDFIQCSFEGVSVDAMFTACRFDACDFAGGGFIGANLIQTDLSNIDVHASTFDDCSFTECDLNEAQFVETSMFGTTFTRTHLKSTRFHDCDLTYAFFEHCNLSSVSFEDADLSDADLSTSDGLTTVQLENSIGNARTKLPLGVEAPSHWEVTARHEGAAGDDVPPQRPAPLKLVWRLDRLVPDPRGGVEDRLRNSALFVVYRELSKDVRELAERPSNHPISRRLKQLSRCLESGIAAVNPVEVGYHGELLRHQLPAVREELSSETVSSIEAVVAGVGMFVAQFSEWREISETADSAATSGIATIELAHAIRDLAGSVRASAKLFDSRVADSLDLQANDLSSTGNNRIKSGALNSAGNIFSALGSRAWALIKRGTTVASEEVLKVYIKQFLETNTGPISELVRLAPTSFGWLRAHFLRLFE